METEVIRAEVKNITFHNPVNGWTVARVYASGIAGIVTVTGIMPKVHPGEMVEVAGMWVDHPKFGRQLEVQCCKQVLPATENGIRRYLGSGLIRGVGPALAGRLLDAFGKEILEILDNEPERLLAVNGVGRKKLKSIIQSWNEQHEVREVMLFLQTHGVSPTYAARIYQRYGFGAVQKLQEDPYELAYEIRGIGFRTADAMALKLGFAQNASERMQAAVIYALFMDSEKGHIFTPYTRLESAVLKLLRQSGGGAASPEGSFSEEELQQRHPCDIPGPVEVKQAVDTLLERKKIMMEDLPEQDIVKAVYLMHFYRQEQELASRLYHLLEHPAPLDMKKVYSIMPQTEEEEKIQMSSKQREAVLGGCEHKVFVITGGPGTGKTTITRVMVQTLSKLGLKIKLAAPTGRAAKRMAEATGYSASTLHRLLQYSPDTGFSRGEDSKLKAQVVVVDEASMLDMQLFLALLRALPLTTRLILIGDVNQLPSVGPGNVLADILQSGTVPRAELTHIYRQAKESLIVVNAHKINAGFLPENPDPPLPEHDFFWVMKQEVQDIQNYIVDMATKRIPKAYGLNPCQDIQVLTPIHKGDLGTKVLNALLQEKINPPGPPELRRGETIFRKGDRVLQLKNNYDKDMFNGDLGWIADVSPEESELLVECDGRTVLYEQAELEELTPAYAISVHKSQGSEYPAVIMPVVTQHYIMLERNLIYTGLTRARQLAVVIGSMRAMQMGLGRNEGHKRFTHLQYRLQGVVNS